jgi:galactonate dehydratase
MDEEGRVYFFVRVDTDKGIHGLGEVGIARQGKAISKAIDHLSEIVIGSDPWETERLWQVMFRSSFFPADKVYSCAISAIDIALWDIKAKSVDLPLFKLLGGPYREKVVCYPHTQGDTLKEFLDICEEHLNKGWKFLRWHQPTQRDDFESNILEPRKSIKYAVEIMSEVRDKFGFEPEITFDVHTRLDPPEVIQMCRDMESLKPFFIEDPIRSENPASYKNIRNKINLPIAAGEQWATKWSFREVIEKELIDYARIDLCIVGGITEALKITHWAETHYINIVPHNPLGPVSAAACVALCMASSNVGVQEMPKAPGTYANNLFPQQIEWEDGYSWCPDIPGLGVDINMDEAESMRTNPTSFSPQLKREDGSFTNW